MGRAFEIHKWVGTESQPTLRAEREALSLIHFLRDQGQLQTECMSSCTITVCCDLKIVNFFCSQYGWTRLILQAVLFDVSAQGALAVRTHHFRRRGIMLENGGRLAGLFEQLRLARSEDQACQEDNSQRLLAETEFSAVMVRDLFRSEFINASLDNDGDVRVILDDGCKAIVEVDEKRKLLKFMMVFGLSEDASLEAKFELVNQMNDKMIFTRFSIPERDRAALICDVFLTFEGGLMVRQLLRSFQSFVKVTRGAVQVMVPDELR